VQADAAGADEAADGLALGIGHIIEDLLALFVEILALGQRQAAAGCGVNIRRQHSSLPWVFLWRDVNPNAAAAPTGRAEQSMSYRRQRRLRTKLEQD
jgi:hypothetical protein